MQVLENDPQAIQWLKDNIVKDYVDANTLDIKTYIDQRMPLETTVQDLQSRLSCQEGWLATIDPIFKRMQALNIPDACERLISPA